MMQLSLVTMAKLDDVFYKNFAKRTLTAMSTPFYKKFATLDYFYKIFAKTESNTTKNQKSKLQSPLLEEIRENYKKEVMKKHFIN